MDLKEYLLNLKNITIQIIKALKEDNIDYVIELLDKREDIINELKRSNVKSFGSYGKELGLIEQDKELKNLFLEKLEKIKMEMMKLKKANSANKTYAKNSNNINRFLNLKI